MNFTEPKFLFLLLPLTLLFYFLSPRAAKNSVLLVASILFYGFGEGWYTFVIVASIVFNYFQGHFIDTAATPRWRKQTLVFGVGMNLLLLIAFKYAGFIVENLDLALGSLGLWRIPRPRMHLPLGISFFTFHAISYIVDVYRREVRAMRRFDRFSLYILLFPQLIAGPIIRYKTICDQFKIGSVGEDDPHPGRAHSMELFAQGIRRFIIGLGKKMLIANTLAETADAIFGVIGVHITPAAAWLAVVCYALQIYFDFSGYSDMAIGLGHMFGFRFPENFNFPYIADSMTDFWRRWHLSLSTWFRDYLYIPLGGNRVSPKRTYLNLLIVFFLCGLWHGATWNFIVWGLWHGLFLAIERAGFGNWLKRRNVLLRHAYALLIVLIGWVFFRAATLGAAGAVLMKMAFAGAGSLDVAPQLYENRHLWFALFAGVIGSMPWLPWVRVQWVRLVSHAGSAGAALALVVGRSLELASLGGIFFISCGLSAAGTYSPFIYFRF